MVETVDRLLHMLPPGMADLLGPLGPAGWAGPDALVAVAVAALVAGFTQGFAGFGSTVVALPLLVAVLGTRVAVPLACLMALVINMVLVGRMFGHVRGGPLGVLLLASLPGMAAGGKLLAAAPEALLQGLMGGMVLVFAWFTARSGSTQPAEDDAQPAVTSGEPAAVAGISGVGVTGGRAMGRGMARHAATVAVGLVSGALGAAVGINGPPVVAWAVRQGWGRHALKATLAGYFLLAGVGIVAAQGLHGEISGRVLLLFCAGLPALAAGLLAGQRCFGRMDEAAFRRMLLVLFAISGAGLLWRAAVAG